MTKLLDTFYTKKLEVVLVGLENSGKTTLLNVLAQGRAVETCPTIGSEREVGQKGRGPDEVLGHRRAGAVPERVRVPRPKGLAALIDVRAGGAGTRAAAT